ncbi:alpha-ribazole phosphatase [Heyndrickxia sporothermodurans]|nr:alpha-ribazole phosphatase [Heyndrickxia sporothermodurans]
MTNTSIYIVRHGQTVWNKANRMQGHLDSQLTKTGKMQAMSLRERLKDVKFDVIYSSSSLRAINTAKIISYEKQTKIVEIEALKEINMGWWEGKDINTIKKKEPENYQKFTLQPHIYNPSNGGESFFQLLNRVNPIIESIISNDIGKNILIVRNRLEDLGKIPDVLSASLSKITIKNGLPFIELYGDTTHYQENSNSLMNSLMGL